MAPRTWRADLIAGITVGVVALPLALGFGIASGAGAEAGLITAIVAGVAAAVLGGSNVQVSGPTGAMVVVLAPIVAAHGVAAVAVVSIAAGLFVVIAGLLKLGRLVALVPWPVIEGFTVGIAVIIFLQQVPSALSTEPQVGANALIAAGESVRAAEWPGALLPAGIVVFVAAMMWIGERIDRRVPGSLVAVVAVTVLAAVAHLPLPTIGALPALLSRVSLPSMDLGTAGSLLGPALAVAALAAIESLLSARVASGLADTGRFDPDRELIGQGFASVASGFMGGIPATGAIARTAVNVRSGARTRVASIVHALVLLLTVLALAPLVSQIPLAALAGVLMFTAARMISWATVRSVVRSSRGSAAAFVVTAVVTISFDLITAVAIGVAMTALWALHGLAATAGVHREEIAGPPQPGDERIEILRLDGALFFASAERVLERVRTTAATVVILRLSQIETLDSTGARTLAELITTLERRSITVLIKGLRPDHATLADRAGIIDSVRGEQRVFTDLDEAVSRARLLVQSETAAG
ncbi:MAG: SulP family inorganic anion transporter [Pseudolysinimonas sp.]